MGSKIEFKRELRDCPYNVELQAKGDKRGLIYDFAVMIDGERRGRFARKYTSRGYDLLDSDHQPIKLSDSHYYGMSVSAQEQFYGTVSAALLAGRIPTLAQIAERKAAKARKAAEIKAAKLAEMQAEQIRNLGPRMFDVLKAFVAKLDTAILVETDHSTSHLADELRQALIVIELAEKPVTLEDEQS